MCVVLMAVQGKMMVGDGSGVDRDRDRDALEENNDFLQEQRYNKYQTLPNMHVLFFF